MIWKTAREHLVVAAGFVLTILGPQVGFGIEISSESIDREPVDYCHLLQVPQYMLISK